MKGTEDRGDGGHEEGALWWFRSETRTTPAI